MLLFAPYDAEFVEKLRQQQKVFDVDPGEVANDPVKEIMSAIKTDEELQAQVSDSYVSLLGFYR